MKSPEKHSNTDDDVGYVRMTLRGDGAGLRFSVPVNGGVAVVTCPAFNICIDGDATFLETREFWFKKGALARAVAFPSVKEIELHMFETIALFKQVDGGETAQTILSTKKLPRST